MKNAPKKWMNWLLIICGSSSLLFACSDAKAGNPFDPGPFDKEAGEVVHENT